MLIYKLPLTNYLKDGRGYIGAHGVSVQDGPNVQWNQCRSYQLQIRTL